MFRLYAERFYWLTNNLTQARFIATKSKGNARIVVDATTYNLLRELKTICDEIGLKMSSHHIQRMLAVEKFESSAKLPAGHYAKAIEELELRIYDELKELSVYVVKASPFYFDEPYLFGEKVFNNFLSANFDITEAGKCFATERYTACVMHLQRVLEIGLKSYGKFLGIMTLITTPQPSWNLVLDKTRKEIRERNDRNLPVNVWASNDHREFCQEVQPFLEAVQVAWRNPSMHADKKYIEKEAKEIFDAVKGFMRHLAEHLNEKGKFQRKRKK